MFNSVVIVILCCVMISCLNACCFGYCLLLVACLLCCSLCLTLCVSYVWIACISALVIVVFVVGGFVCMLACWFGFGCCGWFCLDWCLVFVGCFDLLGCVCQLDVGVLLVVFLLFLDG